jgi:hypothetical protein
MPIFTFPHIFKDGVGEIASGTQVMEDLEAIRNWIEEHEAHYYVTPGGLEGNLIKGSKQEVPKVAAGTLVHFHAMMTATWNASTEGGYTLRLYRDGGIVAEEALSVSANKAVTGYWVGDINIDFIQPSAGAHTWEVQIFGFGTEIAIAMHRGLLSLTPQ